MRRFLLVSLLILSSGLVQNTGLFSIFGIKPNLLLAVLIAGSFFIDSLPVFWVLLLESVIFLRFESGFQLELLVWVALLCAAYFAERAFPWRRSVNNLVLIATVTALFYLITDIDYLVGVPLAVLGEVFYTSIFGVLFYDIFRQLGDNEENIFKR